MSKKKWQKGLMFAAVAGCAVLTVRCGSHDGTATSIPVTSVPVTSVVTQSRSLVPAIANVPLLPGEFVTLSVAQIAGFDALRGIYDGTLVNASGSQPYTLVIGSAQPGSTAVSYPALLFWSSGPLGLIQFQAYLSTTRPLVSLPTPNGGRATVLKMALARSIPELSAANFALEITVALRNGNQFDPTQSSIHIKDCGFSEVSCFGDASDASFAGDFVKR